LAGFASLFAVVVLAVFIAPASGSAAGPCPNETIREAQNSTHLPGCRAWEMVTPLQKGNGDIVGDGNTNVASVDGDAVTFNTRTPFGDTVGSGVSGQTQYIGSRSATGWTAHSITPQPRPDAYQTFFGATRYHAYSDDLSTAVLVGYDFPSAVGDIPLRNNIYVEDTASRALQPVTAMQGELPNPLPHPIFELSAGDSEWGTSDDARHVAFVSRAPYLPIIKQANELHELHENAGEPTGAPGEQSPGTPNVLQSDNGVLSLAGILPDGSLPPAGSNVVSPIGDGEGPIYRDAMSDDGSRQLFVSPPAGNSQLYQRIDGVRTAWISEPERPGQGEPEGVVLAAATPDGRNVFFSTTSRLLEADENDGADLYRWTDSPDPGTEDNLTLVSNSGFFTTGGQIGQAIGVSNDGQRIYYHTNQDKIFAWDGGSTHLVSSEVPFPENVPEQLSVGVYPGYGRVTPDGNYLAFASKANSVGIGPTGDVTEGHREMYIYSLATDTLKCISCPSGPATADITVLPQATFGVITYTMPGIRPRFLSDDGRVFFSTTEALLAQDTNGVADTYQYDPASGALSLLSSGKGSDPAMFTDASASGDDVFLVTRQQFVPSDTDDLVDLYDVRTGGGFAESAPSDPPVCSGEACQPAAPSPPAAPPSSSSTLTGRGNVKHPRCPKGKHKVRRDGKVRCVKKQHKRDQRQHARAGRGATK
jgi:hypothetical protein